MTRSALPMIALAMPPASREVGAVQAISAFRAGLPTSSTRCSASSWTAAGAAKQDPAAAVIFGTTSRFRLRVASAASKRRFEYRPWSPASSAKAAAPRPAPNQSRARPATVADGRASSKASSRSSEPAPHAREPDGLSIIPARLAPARAGPTAKRHCRSTFRPVWRTAPASVWPGEGEVGIRGASAGDLSIFIAVAPHRIFQRDGANIFCRVPIPFTTAALGGAIEVPTAEGSRPRVTVPAGTQSGHQFRLRGKGMTVLRSAVRGDMYIQAIIETPVNLTKRQQELLREFEQAGESRKTNPESEGFFARVKEFFEDLRE